MIMSQLVKFVTQVKLVPTPVQAAALKHTLRTVNEAACWVSEVAFERGVPREYELRKHTYAELRERGLGAQVAQHVIKKVRDAYTSLHANLRAGNLGKKGSKRRIKAEAEAREPDGFIGVDLGIVNIATTSTGHRTAGRKLNRYRRRQLVLRAKLQKKGTKSAKRLLRKQRRAESRRAKDVNHRISKTI